MQGNIEQVIAERVELALRVVDGKTQVKKMTIFWRGELKIFVT